MGRHRTIDRDGLLDAAERVVIREGAAHLTLEAVAVEAGISKASVLYDYKAKRGLIRALIERRVASQTAQIQTFVDALEGEPNADIRGRLAATSRAFSDEERSVSLNLCAALAQDATLREPVQKAYGEVIGDITRNSTQPRGAMLAFLAAEGLILMEWFGLHSWSAEDRERLVADIGWLVEQAPPVGDDRQPVA